SSLRDRSITSNQEQKRFSFIPTSFPSPLRTRSDETSQRTRRFFPCCLCVCTPSGPAASRSRPSWIGSEVRLDPELEEAAGENPLWSRKGRSIGGVDCQDRVRVEQIIDVEIPL